MERTRLIEWLATRPETSPSIHDLSKPATQLDKHLIGPRVGIFKTLAMSQIHVHIREAYR
eukprot:1157565-Pelagomonas_calceolata.AAC.5